MTIPKLVKLSPSKIHFIDSCKLRYLFSSMVYTKSEESSINSLNFNKYSFLGIVIHNVIDFFFKNQPSIIHFEAIWEKVVKKEMFPFEGNIDLNQIEYHTSFYTIKKKQTRELVKELFPLLKKGESEKLVSSKFIEGKADLVIKNIDENSVRVIDFKSGPIWDLLDFEKFRIKESYQVQLKTYGYTFWKSGYSPENISCELIGLSKSERVEFFFTNSDYSNHEKFLKNLILDINKSIKLNQIDKLGNPKNQNCNFCDFVGKCNKLHKEISSIPEVFENIALIHLNNCEFDDDLKKIKIINKAGNQSIHRIPESDFTYIKEKVNLGLKILFINLNKVSGSNVKNWTNVSQYYSI